jgi:hypothetical protein
MSSALRFQAKQMLQPMFAGSVFFFFFFGISLHEVYSSFYLLTPALQLLESFDIYE